MAKDKLTLIYISQINLSFYKPKSKKFFSTPIKNGLLDDMSISDEDALALFVNEFVKGNVIEMGSAILILSKELLFVKTYKDIIELEIDRENFITNIPFNPGELTFVEEGSSEGAYSIAANRGLCNSLKVAFEKAGFDIEAIIPDDLNSTKLTSSKISAVSKDDQEKLDFMKPRSTKNPKYKNKIESGRLLPIKKTLRSKLPIFIGVIGALIIGIVFLLITNFGDDKHTDTTTETTQSTESVSIDVVEPVPIEESPFALEIDDVTEDNNMYKAREELKITFVDNPQNIISDELFVIITQELSESGFLVDSKTTGEPYVDPVTIVEHASLVSDEDLYAISDYLYARFEDVRREEVSDDHNGDFDITIKTGKILD